MVDKLGVRIIKTAIAVAIAIGLAQLLDLEYPFFAGMTALISMDATAVLSLKMARNRVYGTMIGALIGVSLSYVARGSALLCGVGTFILIKVCNKLKLQGAIGIGGIVMFAIMVHTDKTPMFYAIHRTIPTILGGLIAVTVNLTLYPNHNLRKIQTTLNDMWALSNRIMNGIQNSDHSDDIATLHRELQRIGTILEKYDGERIFPKRRETIEECEKEYRALHNLYHEALQLSGIDSKTYPEVYQYHYIRAHQIYSDNFSISKVVEK